MRPDRGKCHFHDDMMKFLPIAYARARERVSGALSNTPKSYYLADFDHMVMEERKR